MNLSYYSHILNFICSTSLQKNVIIEKKLCIHHHIFFEELLFYLMYVQAGTHMILLILEKDNFQKLKIYKEYHYAHRIYLHKMTKSIQ